MSELSDHTPAVGELCRVVATTLLPDFLDYYGIHGGPYNPAEVGEVGFMTYAIAITAEGTGDVAICWDNTPLEIEALVAAYVPPV